MNSQLNINPSNFSDLLFLISNQYYNKSQLPIFQSQLIQSPSKNIYINKINQLNKNISSSIKNLSLSTKERENIEEENNPIFKEYIIINNKKSEAVNELKDINEKINENISEIEEIRTKLADLKNEKNQKKADIVNLLSNKESMEEIYKNQIYLLINPSNNENNIEDSNKNNEYNINNINKNNHILTNDGNNFKISLNDIKDSDQNKYIEQVNNMSDDIFTSNNTEIKSLIMNIINNIFEVLLNNKEENENNNEIIIDDFFTKLSLTISNHSLGKYPEVKINILLRYLLLINSINKKLNKYMKFVNKKYKEKKTKLNDSISDLEKNNKELHQKINKLDKNIKEFDDKLENLVKNINFQSERISKNFIEEDNICQTIDTFGEKNEKIEEKENSTPVNNNINIDNNRENINNEEKVNSEKDNNIIDMSNKKVNKDENTKIIGRNENNIIEKNGENKNENENQLSHEVIIEYEDGIDQNVEINYEADDMSNEYNYEKETELINQGINPYNNNKINKKDIIDNNEKENKLENLQNDIKNISITNKQSCKDKKETQQKIVNDVDKNDKNLNNLINNIKHITENNIKNKSNDNNILKNNIENNIENNNLKSNKKKENKINNKTNDNNKLINNKDKNKENIIDYIIVKKENKKDKAILEKNKKNKNAINEKLKKIINNFNIYNNKRDYSRRNHYRNNHKILEIKEKNDNSLNSNIKKINDYTFNISINNSNKNIFTENVPKNNNNIKNLKTKLKKSNNNINYNQTENLKLNNNSNSSSKSHKINLQKYKSNEKFELAKRIKYNKHLYTENNKNDNNKTEEIITYKISSITKNELQGISNKTKDIKSDKNLDDIIKRIQINNFSRVQRILNVNDTNSNISISKNNFSENNNIKENSIIISPIKKNQTNLTSMKEFDKKIQLKGGKNRNYISIINITNNAPIQKKDENNFYDEHKIYTKKIKGNFNKNKFFEKSPINEANIEKNKFKNKKEKNNQEKFENKGNITNTNSENNIDVIEPIKMSKNIKKIDLSQYFSYNKYNEIKTNDKENGIIISNSDNNNNNQTAEKNIENNINDENNKAKIKNGFFNNTKATTLKITKSREVDINKIKNTRLSLIKRNFSKTLSNKNKFQEKDKDKENENEKENNINKIFLDNKLSKNSGSLNNYKNSLLKIKNKKRITSFSFKTEKDPNKIGSKYKYRFISYDNLKKILTKRANSLNNENKNNIEKKETYKCKNNEIEKKVMNIKSNDKNKNIGNSLTPEKIKKLKIISIPISKIKKNKNNYNNNTYDININRQRNRNNLRIKKYIDNNTFDFSDINNINYKENSNTINVDKSYFTYNINYNFENFDDELNIITKGTKEIFCYFRIYNQNNVELNLLEKKYQNLEIFGFYQGYIIFNFKKGVLKFIKKINNNELYFYLKDIIGLEINQYMINLIKNHSLGNCEIEFNGNPKLDSYYFSFNLIINDVNEGKIECIFNSFEIYIFLLKYIDQIVEYNKNDDTYEIKTFNNDI